MLISSSFTLYHFSISDVVITPNLTCPKFQVNSYAIIAIIFFCFQEHVFWVVSLNTLFILVFGKWYDFILWFIEKYLLWLDSFYNWCLMTYWRICTQQESTFLIVLEAREPELNRWAFPCLLSKRCSQSISQKWWKFWYWNLEYTGYMTDEAVGLAS